MNIGQQILFLVSLLGACNGLLLGIYLLLNRKRRSIASIFLGLLLLALCLRVGKSVFVYFNPALPKVILQIGLTGCFMIGPSLYYFLRSAVEKPVSLPVSWKWILGIQAGAIVLAGLILPYQTTPWVWNKVFVYIIYGQWDAYILASGWFLWKTYRAGNAQQTMKFLLTVYLGNLFVFLAYQLSWVSGWQMIYIIGPICFSFMLYVTVGFSFYGAGFDQHNPIARPERKKIADGSAQRWAGMLEKAVEENGLYKNPNLKLNDLAQQINIPGHQLSQLLNDHLGKSFSTYINEYRVEAACKLIASGSPLTFEAIGYEVGYNSKSTFYAAFRKVKGTTPALFKEELEKMPN